MRKPGGGVPHGEDVQRTDDPHPIFFCYESMVEEDEDAVQEINDAAEAVYLFNNLLPHEAGWLQIFQTTNNII